MIRSITLVAAVCAATALAACSQAEEAPAVETAEVAAVETVEPQPAVDPAQAPASGLSDGDRAFIATLSPLELGQARLSCIEPLRTASFWGTRVVDAELAAALKAAPDMSRTAILAKAPMNTLTIDQARAIMDAGPKFDGSKKATAEEAEGLKQCILLAQHFAEEKGAK